MENEKFTAATELRNRINALKAFKDYLECMMNNKLFSLELHTIMFGGIRKELIPTPVANIYINNDDQKSILTRIDELVVDCEKKFQEL